MDTPKTCAQSLLSQWRGTPQQLILSGFQGGKIVTSADDRLFPLMNAVRSDMQLPELSEQEAYSNGVVLTVAQVRSAVFQFLRGALNSYINADRLVSNVREALEKAMQRPFQEFPLSPSSPHVIGFRPDVCDDTRTECFFLVRKPGKEQPIWTSFPVPCATTVDSWKAGDADKFGTNGKVSAESLSPYSGQYDFDGSGNILGVSIPGRQRGTNPLDCGRLRKIIDGKNIPVYRGTRNKSVCDAEGHVLGSLQWDVRHPFPGDNTLNVSQDTLRFVSEK